MAYNRKNLLEKVKAVNEVYIEHSARGVSNEYIFNNYIKNRFYISRTTFYEYLTIPYMVELRKIEDDEQK